MKRRLPYSSPMRWQAIIVLAVIAFSIVIPPSLPLMSHQDAQASIGTLDVCHSAVPALSSGGEMPYMGVGSCFLAPLVSSEIIQTSILSIKPLLIPFLDERPPKA